MLGWIFNRKCVRTHTQDDLVEAELHLLEAAKQREYWQAMEEMYKDRIDRLKKTTMNVGEAYYTLHIDTEELCSTLDAALAQIKEAGNGLQEH